MHEVSLGTVIRDYLTGEWVEETTYEDLRQALARLLVEEKGYPRAQVRPKVDVCFQVDGRQYARAADLAVYGEDGRALFLVLFCSGMVASYRRETVSAARLVEGGPAPLAAVTDLRQALLLETASGNTLGEGMDAIPAWDDLLALASAHPCPPLDQARAERERRILHTYSGFLKTCCGESCPPPEPGK